MCISQYIHNNSTYSTCHILMHYKISKGSLGRLNYIILYVSRSAKKPYLKSKSTLLNCHIDRNCYIIIFVECKISNILNSDPTILLRFWTKQKAKHIFGTYVWLILIWKEIYRRGKKMSAYCLCNFSKAVVSFYI